MASPQTIHKRALHQLLSMVILSVAMVSVVTNIGTIQTYLSQALGEEADLIIDAQNITGPLTTPWRSIAQGGESAAYRFAPAFSALQQLQPQYLRLDHVLNMYSQVKVNPNGSLSIDFSHLDRLLGDISTATATPFIALSYTPPSLSGADVTDVPQNWSQWQDLIRQTIEHISGASNLNFPGVYYEVWNEPDLFGKFKTYGPKNYLTLYEQTVLAAQSATNTQPFYIGGPATTDLYANWVTSLVNLANSKNLRLDFYSWHLYSKNPLAYQESLKKYYSILNNISNNTQFPEPIITEWGITPEVDSDYDNNISAAHLVSVSSVLSAANITKAFVFEFQDGLDPNNQPLWGRWGLVTHQNFNSQPKPRFSAMQFLNRLGPQKLHLIGEGTWVRAIATKKLDNSIALVITNYDHRHRHTEVTPITFQNLIPGRYSFTLEYLGRAPINSQINIASTTYATSVPFAPNEIVYIELKAM